MSVILIILFVILPIYTRSYQFLPIYKCKNMRYIYVHITIDQKLNLSVRNLFVFVLKFVSIDKYKYIIGRSQ